MTSSPKSGYPSFDLEQVAGFSVALPRQSHTTSNGQLRVEPIEGISYRLTRPVSHTHGHLTEVFREDWSLTNQPVVQVNFTTTFPGHVRAWGLHAATIDRLFVATGSIRIVCFDGRQESSTFGRINEFYFGERNPGLLVIPVGVYHGWKNVGDTEAAIISMPSCLYDHDGPDRFELPWDAPTTRELIDYEW